MARKCSQIDTRLAKLYNYLKQRMNISAIFLFGSQVSDQERALSDIDLAIFSKDVGNWTLEEKVDAVVEIRRLFGLDIDPHFFSDEDLNNARPTNFTGHIIETGRKIA